MTVEEFSPFEDLPLFNDSSCFGTWEPRIPEATTARVGFPAAADTSTTAWDSGFGSATWHEDDYFHEIGDLFPLEPLPAVF
ncbi:AP2 domain containing protein [Musa troglodytarum]|nr:AP2 domain containing protein [Musa troglodytarum]